MSTQVVESTHTPQQLELIKATVAKGATNDELKLFLYRARELGLDPLKPGQIYFAKYGNNPGTIIVGIEGFRTKAGRTGKHVGTKRGVMKDAKGALIGAWAEVFRSDWKEPAREEVPLSEYNTGKSTWIKMPETMIKKVAECAALRMAFPDELGGVYAPEEMDQAIAVTEVRALPDGPTQRQLKRLFAISKSNGWDDMNCKAYMKEKFGITSSKQLTGDQYQEMCTYIEQNVIGDANEEFVPPSNEPASTEARL